MAYTKTSWVNDSTPAISANNLNKIENGIYDLSLISEDTLNDISSIINEEDKSYSLTYEQGTILLDGQYAGTPSDSTTTIRTTGFLNPGKYYVNTNNQQIAIALYNSNTTFTPATFVGELGTRWTSGDSIEYIIPSGRYAKILVRKNGTDIFVPSANATVWKTAFKISNDVNDLIGVAYEKNHGKLNLNYEQGGILFDGQYAGTKFQSNDLVRSTVLLSEGKYYIDGKGQEFTVCSYNSKTTQSSTTFVGIIGNRWETKTDVTIPSGQYALISVKKTDSSAIIPSECVVESFKYIEILQEIRQIKEESDSLTNTAVREGYYSFACQSTEFISRMGEIDSASTDSDTLLGIKKARKFGYFHIRHSLSFTSDSVPVLAHNETIEIDGTTYTIAETPYATLEGHITSLEDAILLNKRLGMKVDLELKFGVSNANIDVAYDMVAKYGMSQATLWTSDNRNYLSYLLEKQRDIKIGYIAYCNTTNIDRAYAMKNEYNYVRLDCFNTDYNPSYPDDYSDATLAYAAQKGIPIKLGSTWDLNNFKKWAAMLPIVEVALIKYPYKVLLDSYLDI